MKKIKMKVVTVCLSLGMIAGTLITPVAAYAATTSSTTTNTISNGIETSIANDNDAGKYDTSVGDMLAESKAWAPGVNFNVNVDVLGIANKIAASISRNNFNGQRAAFCKNLMETTFYAAGGRYNVVVMDLSQNYSHKISGVKMYAGYQFDGTTYGVWVFDKNQPKGSYFRNDGRRGWDHWAARGWQKLADNVMWYNR
ncbi:hypothetical protein E4V42_17610 [Clostridium estertheticum]|uniref:Stress protein n=1 Tax=Clostridium estertheticum TaxID=238834 RepID=A0A5N7ISM1_9CLOT|nr:hypothetical protein [Clostridium estertheticum]MPQ33242.1 hypothetical protein [Clostridium estertheticum]MPQ63900.1 hypothetical protein [Clostridium estertheticum]